MNKKQLLENQKEFVNEIRKGKIFIYPTDTVYGIGCDATNVAAIDKVRRIKQSDQKPFSIIVPDKSWILENCIIEQGHSDYLNKLPGKFTFIIKLKPSSTLPRKQIIGSLDSIGVRIPDNWFSEFLSKNTILFITTSANLSGQPPITKVQELEKHLANQIDYIIDDGELPNNPSKIIDLTKSQAKIIRS